ncbi:MAG: hypothetical protein HC838_16855, partial [Spirulinaceae cyanobacterium RM2_2_10]|nr:hypothetical protein [Spirulinaceae cyanobacterium RM2_2_10]
MALLSIPWPEIPACAWRRPLGRGWEKPATALAGCLDTGPWQGMPLGGLGAGWHRAIAGRR